MNNTEQHLIETYSTMFNGLSSSGKMALIENLTKSLKNDSQKPDFDIDLKPFSVAEMNDRILKSEEDFENNRFKMTSELLSKY